MSEEICKNNANSAYGIYRTNMESWRTLKEDRHVYEFVRTLGTYLRPLIIIVPISGWTGTRSSSGRLSVHFCKDCTLEVATRSFESWRPHRAVVGRANIKNERSILKTHTHKHLEQQHWGQDQILQKSSFKIPQKAMPSVDVWSKTRPSNHHIQPSTERNPTTPSKHTRQVWIYCK